MNTIAKSRALRALRALFGPSARFSRVDAGGLEGVRVLVTGAVAFQTFDLTGDVWRRAVQQCLPHWRHLRAKGGAA